MHLFHEESNQEPGEDCFLFLISVDLVSLRLEILYTLNNHMVLHCNVSDLNVCLDFSKALETGQYHIQKRGFDVYESE